MTNRLKFELQERKRLEEELEKLNAQKKTRQLGVEKQKTFLQGLPRRVSIIGSAAKPGLFLISYFSFSLFLFLFLFLSFSLFLSLSLCVCVCCVSVV